MTFWGFLKAQVGYKKIVNIREINPNNIKEGEVKRISRNKLLYRKKGGLLLICDIKKKKCEKFKGLD